MGTVIGKENSALIIILNAHDEVSEGGIIVYCNPKDEILISKILEHIQNSIDTTLAGMEVE
jgi:hypothetical protein